MLATLYVTAVLYVEVTFGSICINYSFCIIVKTMHIFLPFL